MTMAGPRDLAHELGLVIAGLTEYHDLLPDQLSGWRDKEILSSYDNTKLLLQALSTLPLLSERAAFLSYFEISDENFGLCEDFVRINSWLRAHARRLTQVAHDINMLAFYPDRSQTVLDEMNDPGRSQTMLDEMKEDVGQTLDAELPALTNILLDEAYANWYVVRSRLMDVVVKIGDIFRRYRVFLDSDVFRPKDYD